MTLAQDFEVFIKLLNGHQVDSCELIKASLVLSIHPLNSNKDGRWKPMK